MYSELEEAMNQDIIRRIENLPVCSAENLLLGISSCNDNDDVNNTSYPSNVYINTSVKIKKVGGESMFGKVVLMEVEGIKSKYILKSSLPNSLSSQETLDREIVIAVYGINKLHKFTPNFPKSYGFFSCGPIINNSIMCEDTKSKSKYFIQDYVENSITYREFLDDKNLDYEQLLSALFQVYISLYIAYDKINFAHNDLHEENVLVQKLDERMTLEYVVNGKKLYHSTDILIKIIDYGYTTLILDGVDYVSAFTHKKNDVRIDPNTTPIVDIYKLDLPYNDNLKLPFMRTIFSFLPKNTIYSDVYFIEEFNNSKFFFKFINKFLSELPVNFYTYTNSNEYPLLKCHKNCDPESIIRSLSSIFKSETYPNTLSEYDFVLGQGYNIKEVSKVKLNNLIEKHSNMLNSLKKNIDNSIKFLIDRDIDVKYLNKYKSLLTYLPLYIDMLFLLTKYDNSYTEEFEETRNIIRKDYNNYLEIFEIIRRNKLIEKITTKTEIITKDTKYSSVQKNKINDDYSLIVSQLRILKKSLSLNKS